MLRVPDSVLVFSSERIVAYENFGFFRHTTLAAQRSGVPLGTVIGGTSADAYDVFTNGNIPVSQ